MQTIINQDPVVLVALPPRDVSSPPLGLASLSSHLQRQQIKTRVVDLALELHEWLPPQYRYLWHPQHEEAWLNERSFEQIQALLHPALEDWADRIMRMRPLLLGISTCHPQQRMTGSLVARLSGRDGQLPIILGGPAWSLPRLRRQFAAAMGQQISAFVVGEGEQALASLAQAHISGDGGPERIPGVLPAVQAATGAEPRLRRMAMDSLFGPDPDVFDPARYDGPLLLESGRGTARAWPSALASPLPGGTLPGRAERILEQLQSHHADSGVDRFGFVDPLAASGPAQLQALCAGIIERGLQLSWTGGVLPGPQLDGALLQQMRQAGCQRLDVHLQSGSDRLLQELGLGHDAAAVQRLLRQAHEAGVETALHIRVGVPGEHDQDFQQTLDLLARCQGDLQRVASISAVYLSEPSELPRHLEWRETELPPWDQGHGWQVGEITPQVRRERGQRLAAALEQLGLALDAVPEATELPELVPEDAGDPTEAAPGSAPEVSWRELNDPALTIERVRLLDGKGEPGEVFEPGGQMDLEIRYRVSAPTEGASLKLQVFHRHPGEPDLLVLSSATSQQLLTHEQGERRILLSIPQLDLVPGTYHCTVGFFGQRDGQPKAHDVHHQAYSFTLAGEVDPCGAVASISSRWARGEGVVAGAGAGLSELALLDIQGQQTARFASGGILLARFTASLPDPGAVVVMAGIQLEQRVVHRTELQGPMPPGASVVEIMFHPLNLLAGPYSLYCCLVDRQSEEIISIQQQGFTVDDGQPQSQGLMLTPTRWSPAENL